MFDTERKENAIQYRYQQKPINENSIFLLGQKRKIVESIDINIVHQYDFSKIESIIDYLKNSKNKTCKDFIKKFVIEKSIKRGGSGFVYMGYYKDQPNRKIAFKFLMENTLKHKNNENQNHTEIKIHNKLKNKNICNIIGYCILGENSCILMEYFKYGYIENFLKKTLEKPTFSETLLNYINISILYALKYIHEKHKIIHMDIKPQNILINEYLTIKLTDFSVAYCYKNTKNNKIKLPSTGTKYFMSPEVLESAEININDASKIDLFSLGVTLYALAFADYPYDFRKIEGKKSLKQIKENIIKNELTFPYINEHSEKFLFYLKNLLNKDLKKRYDITQALQDPWVKGGYILLDEKEKLYNTGKFLVNLMVDNVKEFNEQIFDKKTNNI